MSEEKTIKRSIRIPSKLYEALVEDSRRLGRSSNQVILDIMRRGVWNRGRGKKERKKMVQIGAQQGWQCPLCRRIYGPFVMECIKCNNAKTELKATEGESLEIDWGKECQITHIPEIY